MADGDSLVRDRLRLVGAPAASTASPLENCLRRSRFGERRQIAIVGYFRVREQVCACRRSDENVPTAIKIKIFAIRGIFRFLACRSGVLHQFYSVGKLAYALRHTFAPAMSSATRTQKLSFITSTSPRAMSRPLT